LITSSPFGFISYNSHDFLKRVFEEFIADGEFSRCACWFHESLGNEKNHFHCWVEPAKQLDTSKISYKFIECTEDGGQQSIAIRPKCKSKWNDAYLYGIHDSAYLEFKGLERELVNIKSDNHLYLGDFKQDIAEAEYYRFKCCLAPYMRVKELFEKGCSLEEVYIKLRIPFGQLNAVGSLYKDLVRQKKQEKRAENQAKHINGILSEFEEDTGYFLNPFKEDNKQLIVDDMPNKDKLKEIYESDEE
jgi:hypothetical protein